MMMSHLHESLYTVAANIIE